MVQDYTEILVVVDISGSMAGIAKDMSGGINKLIEDQKMVQGKCLVTLVEFGSRSRTVFEGIPIENVLPYEIHVDGLTALNDALCMSVDRLGVRLAAMPEDQRPAKVVVIVVTDGAENASQEFTREDATSRVKIQSETYGWQFVFLGANIDAFAVGDSYGFAAASSVQYDSTPESAQALMFEASASLSGYRSGRMNRMAFTDDQRKTIRKNT